MPNDRTREGRRLRSDAADNLDRVLAAAHAVFSEAGPDGQMAEVARRAGVGVGTVYRRFHDKEALLREVLADRAGQLDGLAERAELGDDALGSLVQLLTSLLSMAAADKAVIAALSRLRPGAVGPPPGSSVDSMFTTLIGRAQAAGQVRRDVTPDDLKPLVAGLLAGAADGLPRPVWERGLRIVVNGITTAGTEF